MSDTPSTQQAPDIEEADRLNGEQGATDGDKQRRTTGPVNDEHRTGDRQAAENRENDPPV